MSEEGERDGASSPGGGDGGGGIPPGPIPPSEPSPGVAVPSPRADDGGAGHGGFAAGPALRYTLAFLLIATFLQARSTPRDEAGPFDALAEGLIPQLASWGIGLGDGSEGDGGTEGTKCPPDAWVDEAFVPQNHPTDLYSPKLDPRNRMSRPPLFPHCALTRWVQLEEETACPAGEEYVTVVRPPSMAKTSKGEGKIPRIIHLSSPSNCLPAATVRTLRALAQRDDGASPAFSIYVHSDSTVDNMLYRKEWWEFPQAKEGATCGSKKLEAVANAALGELAKAKGAGERRRMAEAIGTDARRDLWRLMVLWEYGGVALDADALHEILSVGGSASASTSARGGNSTAAGFDTEGHKTLQKLMRQWSSEEEANMLLYFVGNDAKERVPLMDVLAAAPHHALIYYAAKMALKFAVWDGEQSIDEFGPTTKISSIRDGLKSLDRGWQNTKTGGVLQLKNEKKETIRFVDGDAILPKSLTSPRTSPWRSIFDALQCNGNADAEEKASAMMRNFAGEQKYVGTGTPFSCHEHMLDTYLQTTTAKKK